MALATGTTPARKLVKRSAASRAIPPVSAFLAFLAVSALGDGCFVFRWNKDIDIKEPTQKAIILYDHGREDLLLQVKYEGPLDEFGWLVPVPGLPTVTKGSMLPFYELSQLTQRHFASDDHSTKGRARDMRLAGGAEERVKIIEVKTVGAYEVSILSAQDAGSLQQWLRAHDYSFPAGKSDIVEEYTHRGWYFVAAKIELNKGIGFTTVSATSPKALATKAQAQRALQSKLSSGELHPLLISFDTPKPVFPLKISGVAGKASEISLYLIASEPLLDGFIFGQAADNIAKRYAQWQTEGAGRARQRQNSSETSRLLGLRFFLDSFYTTNRPAVIPESLRDYTQEDLLALVREEHPPLPERRLGEVFYAEPGETLQCLRLTADELPACKRMFSPLKAGEWFVTKQVRVFMPAEMRDLEFEQALASLARMLAQPWGSIAAQTLGNLGPKAHRCLIEACSSTNDTERLNAIIGIETSRQPDFCSLIAHLLQDASPSVRLHSLRVADANPDKQLIDLIIGLLRDREPEIRQEAAGYLSNYERPERTPFYLALMRDPDPDVRASAVGVATWINRYATSDTVLQEALRLLKDPDEHVRYVALRSLYQMRNREVPREDILPLLSSPMSEVSALAHAMLRTGPPGPWESHQALSIMETARLLTNRVATARLAGLQNLQQRGEVGSVELLLPLLTDTNKLVRNRAFYVLRNLTGENVSADDPARWQAWWNTNKSSVRKK